MKKTQIIIITIALILTLGCVGTFAILYFATDTFKSDKDLFYKYASQIDFKEFIDLESYSAYSERLKTEGHANEGEFTVEFAGLGETVNESIKYNGYTDSVNKTANYDVSINKDNETLLEMNYLNNQDFYGILFKDVVGQYVVFENNNLKEFASKMGAQDTSNIPNKIEIPETVENINYQEINTILNTYLNIAIQEIPEENYSKIAKQEISLNDQTVKADGYQVKLKVKDVQKILTKVLENAKNDEHIYNLLNSEDITFEDYQAFIDEMLLEITGEISAEDNVDVITISVYKNGKDTVKLAMNIALEETENIEIAIEKTDAGLILKCSIIDTSLEDEEGVYITITKAVNSKEQENFECVVRQISGEQEIYLLNINILRNGELTTNNVQFKTTVTLSALQENVFEIEMKNSANFLGVPKEGEFEQGNHLVINGLTSEQITNLVTNLGSLLGEKLKDEMFVSMVTSIMTVNDGLFETAQQAAQETQNALEQESALSSIDNQLVQTFNSQFIAYEGTKRGSEIKSLYNVVASSNGMGNGHLVVCSGPAQEEIVSSKTYNVSLNKDVEGYINQIIIEEAN